jgi:SAM-dependent methyltransferase
VSDDIKKCLNLGCGANKIDNCVNVDVEESCNPDIVHDFTKAPLPFESDVFDEVYLFHTIEHISKRFHRAIFYEIHRVLKPDGMLIVSFPEFSKCFENWKTNKNGQKEFWEATLYGRQLYNSDYHVCAMDAHDFSVFLMYAGFTNIVAMPEPKEDYNTFVTAKKTEVKSVDHITLIKQEMESIQLKENAA